MFKSKISALSTKQKRRVMILVDARDFNFGEGEIAPDLPQQQVPKPVQQEPGTPPFEALPEALFNGTQEDITNTVGPSASQVVSSAMVNQLATLFSPRGGLDLLYPSSFNQNPESILNVIPKNALIDQELVNCF